MTTVLMTTLRRLRFWASWGLAALAVAVPTAATSAPVAFQPFAPYWVTPEYSSGLWSGPGSEAYLFGLAPAGASLKVLAPLRGDRFPVWNPLTQSEGWIDADVVGSIDDPSEEELAALTGFQSWWAMTHKPAISWSSEGPDAQPWGEAPMWRYFQVLTPTYFGRVLTLEPRTESFAWIDVTSLGPVGEPPPEYFAEPPPDDEVLDLPARIVRDTDRYELPELVDHFALDRLFQNDPVRVEAAVAGSNGDSWFRIGPRQYVPGRYVRLPESPDLTWSGRWIDAKLTEPVLITAYEGDQPVYSALAIKGTVAYQTPVGVYRVLRRVENETMDSETIGIPRDHKDGYYLKEVLFTQYFTWDGAALHHNYWRSNWGYGGSKGCLGLNYDDSLFLWEFATVGTPIYIHN